MTCARLEELTDEQFPSKDESWRWSNKILNFPKESFRPMAALKEAIGYRDPAIAATRKDTTTESPEAMSMKSQDYRQGVTIYGQIVLDHMVNIRHVFECGDLRPMLQWDSAGNIHVRKNAGLSTPYVETANAQARRLVFSVDGDFDGDVIRTKAGAKITGHIAIAEIDKEEEVLKGSAPSGNMWPADRVARFGYPRQVPGGGGTNVSYALYNVFRNLAITYVSVYSKEDVQDRMILKALEPVVAGGSLELQQVDPYPAVNVVVEGIANDRLIIRSPRSTLDEVNYYPAITDVVMVNTCYNVFSALNGLLESVKPGRRAVIACTQSLCSQEDLPKSVQRILLEWVKQHCSLELTKIKSVYDFVKSFIMRESDVVTYIFNEEELDHFMKPEGIAILNVTFRRPLFDAILSALNRLRQMQVGKKPEMVVTLGEQGALYLDKNDGLHYCRVSKPEEVKRVPRERNAIGDLFASFIVAAVCSRGNRAQVKLMDPRTGQELSQTHVPSVLIAACAGAEAGVYDGFMEVDPVVVNSLIHTKVNGAHYSYLGKLSDPQLAPTNFAGAEAKWVFETMLPDLCKAIVTQAVTLEDLVDPALLTGSVLMAGRN
jgi:hypothetical protein